MTPLNPLPPAFRFKQSLAHFPKMLGPRFDNLKPILRAPVFIMEGGIHPVHVDRITPDTIKLPYPSIVLQMQPFDSAEIYVFVLLDSRIAEIPGLAKANLISIMTCMYQEDKNPQLFDIIVDVDLVSKNMSYFYLVERAPKPGEDKAIHDECIFVANLCLSSLYTLTNDRLHYQMAGVRQMHRDHKLADHKLGQWGWTYRLLKIDPAKQTARSAAVAAHGTHASPSWHERRGHWRHLRSGKDVWVRHCEVGQREHGGVIHDYLVREGAGS